MDKPTKAGLAVLTGAELDQVNGGAAERIQTDADRAPEFILIVGRNGNINNVVVPGEGRLTGEQPG